jgi:hypothetical protein
LARGSGGVSQAAVRGLVLAVCIAVLGCEQPPNGQISSAKVSMIMGGTDARCATMNVLSIVCKSLSICHISRMIVS